MVVADTAELYSGAKPSLRKARHTGWKTKTACISAQPGWHMPQLPFCRVDVMCCHSGIQPCCLTGLSQRLGQRLPGLKAVLQGRWRNVLSSSAMLAVEVGMGGATLLLEQALVLLLRLQHRPQSSAWHCCWSPHKPECSGVLRYPHGVRSWMQAQSLVELPRYSGLPCVSTSCQHMLNCRNAQREADALHMLAGDPRCNIHGLLPSHRKAGRLASSMSARVTPGLELSLKKSRRCPAWRT